MLQHVALAVDLLLLWFLLTHPWACGLASVHQFSFRVPTPPFCCALCAFGNSRIWLSRPCGIGAGCEACELGRVVVTTVTCQKVAFVKWTELEVACPFDPTANYSNRYSVSQPQHSLTKMQHLYIWLCCQACCFLTLEIQKPHMLASLWWSNQYGCTLLPGVDSAANRVKKFVFQSFRRRVRQIWTCSLGLSPACKAMLNKQRYHQAWVFEEPWLTSRVLEKKIQEKRGEKRKLRPL